MNIIKKSKLNIDCRSDIKRAVGKIKNSVMNIQTMESIDTDRNVLSMMAMEKEFMKL